MDEISGIPLWKDVNPRLGASYDIFGTGRTAMKISLGRYLELSRSDFTRNFHPFTSSANAATRRWADTDGDFEVDADQANFSANGELGPISNNNFGLFPSVLIDDGTVRGVPNELFHNDIVEGNRTYLWDFLVEVQHEVVNGVSISFGYNRNWAGAFRVEDNTSLEPSDFDEYCVTVPDNPLFDNAGAQQCGFYDVSVAKFGLVNNLNTTASVYGDHKKEWDGFVFSLDGRFPNGATLAGGLDVGKQLFDFCYTIDRPNQPREMNGDFYGTSTPNAQYSSEFCSYERSWGDLTDFRIRGSYPLPSNFNVAWTWRDSPGQAVNARLGPDPGPRGRFVGGRSSETLTRENGNRAVQINPLLQSFTDRHRQLDVRFTRRFDLQGLRFDTSIDIYNALNNNPTLSLNGAASSVLFLQPTTVLDGRLLQLYAQMSF